MPLLAPVMTATGILDGGKESTFLEVLSKKKRLDPFEMLLD